MDRSDQTAADQVRGRALLDRRRRPRYPLRWEVRLFRESGSVPITGVTRDISSISFSCLLSEPLGVGEQFRCSIIIPSLRHWDHAGAMSLDIKATVTRVEKSSENGSFNVACLIDDYRVVPAV